MNKRLAIIGAGGHGKVVGEIAALNKYEIIDFFDDKVNEIKNFPFTVRDTEAFLIKNLKNYDDFFVAIGNNEIREKAIEIQMKTSKTRISVANSGNSLYLETRTVSNINEDAVKILAF